MGTRSVLFTYEEEWEERAKLNSNSNLSSSSPSSPNQHDEGEREKGREEERVFEAERIVASLGEMVNLSFVEDPESDVDDDEEDDASKEKEKEKRAGRIVRVPRRLSSFPFLGGESGSLSTWAVGVAVLMVVGAVGVGVWRAHASGQGGRGMGGWKGGLGLGGVETLGLGWLAGSGGFVSGVWEGLVGIGK